jgi:AraC-like DNA-binding protein
MRGLVRALSLLGLPELVSEFGGDLRDIARDLNFDMSVLTEPDRLVSARKAHELVNHAAARLGRQDLGLQWGARSDPSRLGPLFVAVAHAETGREALELVASFLHLNFPLGAVLLEKLPRQRELLAVRSYLPDPPPLTQFYERRVGSLHVVVRQVCGAGYGPDEVWFSHDQLSPMPVYERVFGVRPRFGMKENGLVIASARLDAVRPSANRQLREMALAYLRQRAPRPGVSESMKVRHMIETLMRTSDCDVATTARAMGLHQRTLQRRLSAEGETFEALRDEARRSLAKTLLNDPTISVTEAGLRLHYANTSAFSRSCQRWFGVSPTQLRQKLQRRSRSRPGKRDDNATGR